jgi:ATP-binding protein involved in chromosome partitioning
VFGKGGAERLAAKYEFPVLGQVPLNPVVRVGGDAGDPSCVSDPTVGRRAAASEAAGRVVQRLAIRQLRAGPRRVPRAAVNVVRRRRAP